MTSSVVSTSTSTNASRIPYWDASSTTNAHLPPHLGVPLPRRRAGLLRRHPGVELGLALLVDLPLFSQRDDLLPREGKLYTCVPVHSCTGTGRCNM